MTGASFVSFGAVWLGYDASTRRPFFAVRRPDLCPAGPGGRAGLGGGGDSDAGAGGGRGVCGGRGVAVGVAVEPDGAGRAVAGDVRAGAGFHAVFGVSAGELAGHGVAGHLFVVLRAGGPGVRFPAAKAGAGLGGVWAGGGVDGDRVCEAFRAGVGSLVGVRGDWRRRGAVDRAVWESESFGRVFDDGAAVDAGLAGGVPVFGGAVALGLLDRLLRGGADDDAVPGGLDGAGRRGVVDGRGSVAAGRKLAKAGVAAGGVYGNRVGDGVVQHVGDAAGGYPGAGAGEHQFRCEDGGMERRGGNDSGAAGFGEWAGDVFDGVFGVSAAGAGGAFFSCA